MPDRFEVSADELLGVWCDGRLLDIFPQGKIPWENWSRLAEYINGKIERSDFLVKVAANSYSLAAELGAADGIIAKLRNDLEVQEEETDRWIAIAKGWSQEVDDLRAEVTRITIEREKCHEGHVETGRDQLIRIRELEGQLAKCGKENCVGHKAGSVQRWVRAERLEAAEARIVELERELLSQRRGYNQGA